MARTGTFVPVHNSTDLSITKLICDDLAVIRSGRNLCQVYSMNWSMLRNAALPIPCSSIVVRHVDACRTTCSSWDFDNNDRDPGEMVQVSSQNPADKRMEHRLCTNLGLQNSSRERVARVLLDPIHAPWVLPVDSDKPTAQRLL